MNAYVAELIGTALLILLGNGVVANVVLKETKGSNSGWIVITFGWGMAVFVAVFCTAEASGAHINPAVTIGLVLAQKFPAADAAGYIAAQMIGAMLGAALVFLTYKDHYQVSGDRIAKLATFGTVPNIRRISSNLFSEIIGTFVLVFAVLCMADTSIELMADGEQAARSGKIGLGSLGALPVGLLVFSIGLSLGGTTGYAINPARDLGPRIMHAILPIPDKGSSDWSYAWVPIVGPIIGAACAAFVHWLTH